MFDTHYNWIENDHMDDVDAEIRRIYPLLIAEHCSCEFCTRSAQDRIDKLSDPNFKPGWNDNDALWLLQYINFACWRIDREFDFYEVSIYESSHPQVPENAMIYRSYPKLSEAICLALIALYQEEWEEFKKF